MSFSKRDNRIDKPLAALCQEILGALAKQFPICMSSDEFQFFPQYRPVRPKWSRWDDFSAAGLATILADIKKRWHQLQQLDDYIDIDEEELAIVRRQLWSGRPAIFAAAGLFSFGAHPEDS